MTLHIHRPRWRGHPTVRSGDQLTLGERFADSAVGGMGSWSFIIAQTILMAVWMSANVVAFIQHWDPYPFILLNLALSTQAAYAAPLVLIASKRSDQRAAERAEHDLTADLESNAMLHAITEHLGIEKPQ